MGLSEAAQMKAQEQRVSANDDGSQAADGSCYLVSNQPENAVRFNLERKINSENKKGIKNQSCINVGHKGAPEPHKVCTMPTWLETWESEDAYAALALIGAAVSLAVAYNCYRQLG
ncbi:hypothetical protein R6Q57_006531 [Mikania cordata]